jgi:hypothetical protein
LAGILFLGRLPSTSPGSSESPSLVLVINDTKLLMPLCQVIWVRHINTSDEGEGA